MGDESVVVPMIDRGNGAEVGLAAIELAGKVVQANRAPRVEQPRERNYSSEVSVPGEELRDYTTRSANAEGTVVHVVQHKEWFEKIPQPPTPEEIAARKKENRILLGVMAGLGTGALCLFGWLSLNEKRSRRGTELSSS